MIFYKVVHLEILNGRTWMYSSSSEFLSGASIEYKVGTWVKAPEIMRRYGYHLLVFDSLENAVKFLGDYSPVKFAVYSAEVRNICEPIPGFLSISSLNKLCRLGVLDPDTFADPNGWPEGSVMVEEVKLLKRQSWLRIEQ